MRTILYLVGICTLIAGLSETRFAKPWNGLFPLKTTRGEVVKLLGPSIGIDEHQHAIFAHSDGVVKIGWKRPDCISEDLFWSEKEANDRALVSQITIVPKVPLKFVEDYEKPEPPPKEDEDLKASYKRWISQDVNCLMDKSNTQCSISNANTGFGYSTSSISGVTGIYYFASVKEAEAFRSTLQPCVGKSN